ncbi:hypothetical protein N7457_003975 [Penicillium paradoxum]|uniref:uncharacterized protein n=1 Tax=Penicillium paradoxum TaxID=176176 RepID=UPI0025481833|nr:uncharacterized protein N7457_003975 [Penicillium paradoxum]KAJ5782201.1 hypothetical protein N7457_003975 [Penicillium paradoxum]
MANPPKAQSPDVSDQDKRAQLDDLIARAAAKDATKDHDSASELYSQATELQAELNGELSPDNADLLYAYGKSLYNVAVSKSDVLGSKVAGEQQSQAGVASSTTKRLGESSSTSDSLVQDAIANSMAQPPSFTKDADKETVPTESKPFFQFTGDENFVDSDDSDDENTEHAEDDEDDDDFANAFEVLDLARVLYLKKLKIAEEEDEGKGKSTVMSVDTKHIKERLADTHDLQAEISLEGERFDDAVTDLRTVLELRNSLYPLEDPSVAECHYKLSLALEFASVQQNDEDDGGNDKRKIDEGMRKEAAIQMERAIESCRVRMLQEEKRFEVEKQEDEDKATATKRKIANVKEIVTEMEQRLTDLRRPPVSIEHNDQANEAMLKGVLGQIIGQSATDQKAQLDAASKGATDLSAFVKRKSAKQPTQQAETSSKRPAEESPVADGSKRSRIDDASS